MLSERKYYKWLIVAVLWGVALLNYLDRQMLSTMKPAIQIDIPELHSAENFGILMAIFLWIYGLMSPISGVIADKMNRKWLIVVSLFVWSLVTYLMGFTTSFYELKWLRGIMGVSEAVYIPAALSLIADYHSAKTRSLAVGIHMTGLYLGQALGGFGATIAKQYSWHFAFHYFGIIGIAYAFVLIVFLREKRITQSSDKSANDNQNTFGGILSLFRNQSFWVILLYFAIPSLPGWATKNWLPTLFSQSLHIDMSIAGPVATITIAASSFVGVISGGLISDKWAQKNNKARIYTSAIGVFLTVPAIILLGFGITTFELVLAAVLFGVGFGMFDANNMPILCQFVPAKYRATAYGLMNMTGVFSGAIITNLLGKSTDAGHLGRDFAFMAGIVFLVLIIQLRYLKPKVEGV